MTLDTLVQDAETYAEEFHSLEVTFVSELWSVTVHLSAPDGTECDFNGSDAYLDQAIGKTHGRMQEYFTEEDG